MKKIIVFAVLLIAAFSSFAQTPNITPVTTENAPQLAQKFEKGQAYLIDVRTPDEYKAGHLAYSKNIDVKSGDFKQQVSKLDKNKPVYLYCRSGNRSGQASDSLSTLGFKTYYNIGGFEQLKSAGLPAAK